MRDLATTANNEYAMAEKSAHDALAHARKAGEALIKAKADQDHGQWMAWLANNWKQSPPTAQRLMRLARGWEELQKRHSVTHLSLNESMKLLANPPKPKPEQAAISHEAVDPEPAVPPQAAQPHETPPEPLDASTIAANETMAVLEQELEEWREKATQAETRLSANQTANKGAESAAERIVALEQENAALKMDVSRLQEEVGRWRKRALAAERNA